MEHGGAEVEPVHSGTHSSVEDKKDRSSQKLRHPGVGHIEYGSHPGVACSLYQYHPPAAPKGPVGPPYTAGQVRWLAGLYVPGGCSGGRRKGRGLLKGEPHAKSPVHEPGVLTHLLTLHKGGFLPQGFRERHPFWKLASETVNEPQGEGGLPCVLPRSGYVKSLRHDHLLP